MITRVFPIAFGATFFAWTIAAAGLVHAQFDAETRRRASAHFERGIELFNEGRYDAALAEFRQAYEIAPAYPVLYNLGRVYAALGRPVESSQAFERYLGEGGDALPAARRREVEQELTRQRARIGRLWVETNVSGSIVSVGGIDVATTPLAEPIALGAGQHVIGIRAPGHEGVSRAVEIAGGTEQRVTVELRREIEQRGTLRITSSIPHVTIRLDGQVVGRTPLESTVPVSAGDHEVTAERPGYLLETRRVHVDDQAEIELRFRMEPDPTPAADEIGTIVLQIPEAPFVLRIDGEERGAVRELRLPVGAHRVEILVAEREPWSGEADIAPQRALTLRPPLTWTPEARQERIASAQAQRDWGIAISIAGGILVAVGLPVLLWNEAEITSTDERGLALQREYNMRCMPFDPAICRSIADDLQAIGAVQERQDAIRVTSGLGLGLGVALAGLGIVLWATSPGADVIDRSARAALRWEGSRLVISGTF